MKKKKRATAAILLFIAVFIVSGCSDKNTGDATWALFKTTNPHPAVLYETEKEFAFAEDLHKYVLSFPEIYDAAIITGKKKVLVAYKVKHMKRFGMKKIEKDLKKKLEKKYSNHSFTVSSDYKIFLEAVKLNEHLKDPTYSRKKAKKEFKDIIKLEKERT
ncbi:sporulation protein [Bacillus testis]|uniref:sporulation protein n=1 Tax=Bacillus testis TaxID=1622072 RepID=UPI00067EF22B|nr:sporulation protein [Bacillus testis]